MAETEANARLIAALLAALKNALMNEGKDGCLSTDYCKCWRCQARAAIAKAEAQS